MEARAKASVRGPRGYVARASTWVADPSACGTTLGERVRSKLSFDMRSERLCAFGSSRRPCIRFSNPFNGSMAVFVLERSSTSVGIGISRFPPRDPFDGGCIGVGGRMLCDISRPRLLSESLASP